MSISLTDGLFLLALSLVTISITIFANDYIQELENGRFAAFFWLFVASMAILVIAKDFFIVFIGWEGLGITSFILVNYFCSIYSFNASQKTVIYNRIGDAIFISALALSFSSASLVLTGLLAILMASLAITNSAIYPFSPWLPAAIAAPTPVSALVHSSTLVTAGVWILLKYEMGGPVLIAFGALTMILGGILAVFESDFKKLVAFSTLSQMGFLFFIAGIYMHFVCMFHMVAHAFFNSMLFACVGYAIMNSFHAQQGSNLSLSSSLFTRFVIVWCLLSMMGTMFVSGFFSKHAFVANMSNTASVLVLAVFALGIVTTALYSVRFLSLLSVTQELAVQSKTQFLTIPAFVLALVFGKFLLLTSSSTAPLSGTLASTFWVLGVLALALNLYFSSPANEILYIDTSVNTFLSARHSLNGVQELTDVHTSLSSVLIRVPPISSSLWITLIAAIAAISVMA